MTSWVHVFSSFTPEALLFEALLISILMAGYAVFWVLRKRRLGSVDQVVPTGVVKIYLNDLILDAERMRAQLFGLLSGTEGARLQNQGQMQGMTPQQMAALANLASVQMGAGDPEASQRLALLESQMLQQTAALDSVIAVTAIDANNRLYPAAVQGGFVDLAAPGVEVLSPLALPFPYSPAAVAVNAVALGRRLRGALARAGGARPIVWTFLPTPIVERLLSALDPRLVIYHAADDFSSSSRGAAPIVASEGRLMARADVVFATSARLEARARRHNAVVHLVPAGVTFDRFERARQAGGDPPPDLAPALRPTVGYVGSVNRRIDDVLVAGVARRLPAASFVFVGPIEAPLPALAGLPNVRLLGPRRHEDVPRYIGGFDAAIIPFRVTDYTHHIYPVKLNEYLAMGVPVVSTRLEEVVRFADEHPDVVALADGDEAFAAALEAAAADRDPDRRARRVEVARESDWSARMASMTGAIE